MLAGWLFFPSIDGLNDQEGGNNDNNEEASGIAHEDSDC